MGTKICSKCGKELPITDFYTKKTGKDGYYSQCETCHRATTRETYRKNKTLIAGKAPSADKKHKVYTCKELAVFEPRELMLELKARGYEGELVYREVKVTEHRINLLKLE